MKMIKAIFFDIDGTLVSFQTHKVYPSTIQALKQLKNKGIKIFIATGRGKDGLGVLDDIEFDGYITLNGQYCYTHDKLIYENTIKKEELEILLDEIHKDPFPCGFTLEHTKIFNYRDERVDFIHSITHNDNHPAGDCSNIINEKVYQCMCFIEENKEKELLKKLKNCTSARWHPSFTDISPLGGTKQRGIDELLRYYQIDLSETMAFGDGGNDKQMLEHVAYSIAMGNGNDDIKKIADYVTDDVDHDGIVKALKHYHLI
jgi:hypothetical protein